MAFQTAKLYSLPKNFILVGGLRMEGFSEDEAVSYEVSSEPLEHMAGADGEVTFHTTNDRRVVVTITVMETSTTCGRLEGLRKAQFALIDTVGRLVPTTYSHVDLISGDSIRGQAIFVNRPTPDKAKGPGTREYVLVLPYSSEEIALGVNNLA